jgi:hypothetical protein
MVLTLGAANWVSGIVVVLTIVTRVDYIYSIPEYSGGSDGKTLHAFVHFVLAPFVAGTVAWGLSSLSMLITRALARGHALATGSSHPA